MVNQLYGSRIRATLVRMQSGALLDLESITSPRSLGMGRLSCRRIELWPRSDGVQQQEGVVALIGAIRRG